MLINAQGRKDGRVLLTYNYGGRLSRKLVSREEYIAAVKADQQAASRSTVVLTDPFGNRTLH